MLHLLLFVIARKNARILFTYSLVYLHLLAFWFCYCYYYVVFCLYLHLFFFDGLSQLRDHVSSEKHPSQVLLIPVSGCQVPTRPFKVTHPTYIFPLPLPLAAAAPNITAYRLTSSFLSLDSPPCNTSRLIH